MINKEQQAVFELKLFLSYEFKCSGYRCSETLSLPATEEQLEEIRKSMEVDQLEQCHIISLVSIKPDLVDYLPQNHELKGLNAFAKILVDQDMVSSEEKMEKLMAALEAEMPDDMEAALEIAGHLEQYEILPAHLQSPKEYAAFVLERENIHVDEKLSPFVDYESFGRYCMKRDGIVQTGKGPILRKDRPIESLPDELSEIRLFSPLKAELYRKVGWGDLSAEPEEISAYELCEYEDSITEQIAGEQLDSEGERGLAIYLHNQLLDRKVASMIPAVEAWQGELWGVLEVKSYGPLSPNMLKAVMDEWSGQESDGWGEGFEQRPIEIDEGELYVSFWNPSDSFFITTEEQLKSSCTQGMPMQMGGM